MDAAARLDSVFHALAHPARREMLRRLLEGERNLSELAAPLKMSFPAASKHVRVLEQARLVSRRVMGRMHVCRVEREALEEANVWLEEYRAGMEAAFQRLDGLLEEMQEEERRKRRRKD
ncbi:MAG: ArsR/SmtB family transcription factor [Phycisphaerales bacterium]